jgi:transposase
MDLEKAGQDEQRKQYWNEQLAAWKASGLKQVEYCREHQISKHAFVYWKLKLMGKDEKPATFVPVPMQLPHTMMNPDRHEAIRLVVGRGYQIEVYPGFCTRTLEELLQVVERRA